MENTTTINTTNFAVFTPIDLSAINSTHLNDFNFYDSLLFTAEELQQDNHWEKYIHYNYHNSYSKVPVGVYMPFANPRAIHEFALNHYVYWMVLYYTKAEDKIEYFYDYNTRESIVAPDLFCWACAYNKFIAKSERDRDAYYACNYCPIWIGKQDFQCENKGELYKRWNEGDLEKAKDIAKMEWHSFDDTLEKAERFKKEYNNFILKWMLSHGHTIEELIKLLTEYQIFYVDNDPIQTIFNEWVLNQGFRGEIWPCFEEWLETEYPM